MKVYKAIEGTETYEQYGEDFIPMWRVAEKDFPRNEVRAATADELIAAIDDDAEWEPNLVEALCYDLDLDFDSYEDCESAYDAAVAKHAAETQRARGGNAAPKERKMEARTPRTKAALMALAEKYHMEFLRHYITDEGYGVYCVSDERIPELDALADDRQWGDAWIFDWLDWRNPPYMYRIFCPKSWINLWGWVK